MSHGLRIAGAEGCREGGDVREMGKGATRGGGEFTLSAAEGSYPRRRVSRGGGAVGSRLHGSDVLTRQSPQPSLRAPIIGAWQSGGAGFLLT